MKLLVVDVGNTSTAMGVWTDGRVSRAVHCDGSFDEAVARFDALAGAAKGAAGVAEG